MDDDEVQRSKMFRIVEVLQYVPNTILSKIIIKKTTGSVTALSFDAGEVLSAKVLPFDTLLQVIDGEAEVTYTALCARHYLQDVGPIAVAEE